jgi:hypothetical protein
MGRYLYSYPPGWVGYPTGWVSWLGNIEHKFRHWQKNKNVTPQSATYNIMKTHQNFLVCNFDSLDLSIWLQELFLRAFYKQYIGLRKFKEMPELFTSFLQEIIVAKYFKMYITY